MRARVLGWMCTFMLRGLCYRHIQILISSWIRFTFLQPQLFTKISWQNEHIRRCFFPAWVSFTFRKAFLLFLIVAASQTNGVAYSFAKHHLGMSSFFSRFSRSHIKCTTLSYLCFIPFFSSLFSLLKNTNSSFVLFRSSARFCFSLIFVLDFRTHDTFTEKIRKSLVRIFSSSKAGIRRYFPLFLDWIQGIQTCPKT